MRTPPPTPCPTLCLALLLGLCLTLCTAGGPARAVPLVGHYGTQARQADQDRPVALSLSLGVEYNDNVNEEKNDTDEDIILMARPAVSLFYAGNLLDATLDYSLTYYDYLKGERDDEFLHDLRADTTVRIIDNLLFLEVADTYTQVYRDVTRGEAGAQETLADLIDQNTFTASPYLLFHPRERLEVKLGYLFQDIRYFDDDDDEEDEDLTEGVDKYSHTGFVELEYDLSERLNLTGKYAYTDLTADEDLKDGDDDYTQHALTAGFELLIGSNSTLFASAGPAWTDWADGGSTTDLVWEAGLEHDFDRWSLKLLSVSSYTEDPDQAAPLRAMTYSAEARLGKERWQLGLLAGYTEFDEEQDEEDPIAQEEDRYFGSLGLTWQPTRRLSATAAFGAEHRRYATGETTLVSPSLGIEYVLAESLFASLRYVHTSSDSSDREGQDEYEVNRVFFLLTKYFTL